MVPIPCPSCGKPLPAGGCSDCGEILACFFCGWPDQEPETTPNAPVCSTERDEEVLAAVGVACKTLLC